MARRLFTIAAVLSLLICAAVVVLWVRSDRHSLSRQDQLSWRWDGVRHTARSHAWGVTLFAPPPAVGGAEARRAAAETVAALANRHVRWEVVLRRGRPQYAWPV